MYKRESGAARRKRKKEEEDRELAFMEKVPRLHRFFGSASSTTLVPNAAAATASDAESVQDVSESASEKTLAAGLNMAFEDDRTTGFHEGPEQNNVAEFLQEPGDIVDVPPETEFDNDPALWPDPPTDCLRNFWCRKGRFEQNIRNRRNFRETEESFGKTRRWLTIGMFHRSLHNREEKLRTWLIYSPQCKSVFCGPCKLFSSK